MSVAGIEARALHLLELYRALKADPRVAPWLGAVKFFLDISGGYWLLCKGAGGVAKALHAALDHSLAELFAVVYNLILAVVFASVLVYAIYAQRAGSDRFLAYQAVGFILVYVVLGAAYSESSGHITEYALPGFWGGLASYLVFCLRSQYLRNPVTPFIYEGVMWAMHGWVGRVAAAVGFLQLCWSWLDVLTRGGLFAKRVVIPDLRRIS